jgi:hypothetical protein
MGDKVHPAQRTRAWWFDRHGLNPRQGPKTIRDCLHRAGWLATAGSTGVYLSIRARMPGVSRAAIDRAAIDGVDAIEVPGAHARPPVLVPPDEMTLALRLHSASYSKHVAPLFASGRYSAAALKAVASQACRALDEGPLSTAAIRASINHPDAGELLVGALIDLAVRGVIRRYPADGRLDSPKYLYELRHPDDRPDLDAEGDDTSIALKATRVCLRCQGPATADEIASWASLTKGAVRKALGTLGAEPISIENWADQAWLLPEDVQDWHRFSGEIDRVVLLPYRDPFVHFRRSQAILARRDTVPVLDATQKSVAIRDVSVMHNHAIVAGGELVGVWEYDPAAERVVTRVWHTDKALGARVAAAADETCRFIREHIGDAKISAVDPPARRARRIAFCRA